MALLRKPWIRRFRYGLLCASAQGAIWFSRIVPRPVCLFLFGVTGSLLYTIPHADRERTRKHLGMIFGTRWNQKKIDATARSVYRELGKNMFDGFYIPRLSPAAIHRIVKHDPLDAFREAYDRGKGVIAITAHTGCFEMLLHLFPVYGFRCFAIGRKLHDEKLDRIVRSVRSGEDIVYMDRSASPRKMVRYLQEGRVFGVLVDQDTAVEGVFADFLGKTAYTPSGPVKMAMKFDTPLFVITTARQKNDTHHVYIDGPVSLESGGAFEENLVKNVNKVNALICRTIERYPEQWVWMHKRWHRRPDVTGTSEGKAAV
jgi:KDO2-lipid IV(A) lauroyltransferase